MPLFAQLLLQHKYGTLTCLQITSHSRNLNTTTFPRRQAGLIPKALKNSDSCCSYCNACFFPCLDSLPFTDYNMAAANTEISQLKLLRSLTLQYSLMGPSLFMATSLIWLLLNRIFPGRRCRHGC